MIDTSKIPNYQNKETVLHADGGTQDIIDSILKIDNYDNAQFCEFAKQFADGEDGLRRLFKFVKYDIRYKVDGFNQQNIKSPAHLWATKCGDCKSKTIFVNQIMRCLGIDYKIRFTKYEMGDFTHVYTIIKLGKKWIPFDTVYDYAFSEKEPIYAQKDYDKMTRIAYLSGFDAPQYAFKTEAEKGVQEIHDKQSYVPNEEYIDFGNITDGEAKALILKRQFQILGAMNPESKAVYQEGENLIIKTLKGVSGRGIYGIGNYRVSGIIPKKLEPLAAALENIAQDKKGRYQKNALSFGLAPAPVGIGTLFNLPGMPTLNYCGGTAYNGNTMIPGENIVVAYNGAVTYNFPAATDNILDGNYYTYGKSSDYKKTAAQILPIWTILKNEFIAARKAVAVQGMQGLEFTSSKCKEAFMDTLKLRSGILTEYVNAVMQSTRKGTAGTGVLYDFCNKVKDASGQNIPLNAFPTTVVAKQIAQSQWVGGMNFFSGVSLSNIELMARNGVLFDTSKQPEESLKALLDKSNSGVGVVPVAVVIAIISAIATAVPAIIATIAAAVTNSKRIDTSKADTARLAPLSTGQLFAESDWKGSNTGTGTGGEDNTMKYLGFAALGLYYLATKDK